MHSSKQFLVVCIAVVAIVACFGSLSSATVVQKEDPSNIKKPAYTLADEKRSRTPAQKKIDSQLLYAIRRQRGDTRGLPKQLVDLKLDAKGRVVVDITSAVPSRVVPKIQALDGSVLSVSQKYHTVRALIALDKLQSLATSVHVRFISLPAEVTTHGGVITH